MINVSNEFKRLMAEDNRNFLVYLDITLKDGTVLDTLENPDIWEGGFKIDDGVTASGQFTIGSCIINKLTVTLNNIYDKFSAYDFDGAVLTAYLGLKLLDGRIEKIRKGIFTVDEPSYDGATITLECLDNMHKLDRDYSEVPTVYPATLKKIIDDICNVCGITLATVTFDNAGYTVKQRPDNEALTCRQVLSYCAQMACRFGRFDTYGRLRLDWFDQAEFEKNNNLDGGSFDNGIPLYVTGDDADGGNFDDYSNGPFIDGGTFDDASVFHHLYSMSSFSVSTDDVVITGIEVTEEFAETERDKKSTVLAGARGYVLSISGNKLIQKGAATVFAKFLANKLIGLRFRPISASVLGDPTVEAGDLAYVTDRKQNTYDCFITNLTFTLGNYMSVSCDAETPSKNSAKQYSEMTQAVVAARKNAQAQINEYNKAVQMLTSLITQSFGVFKTEEVLEDGSTIYYMHDKPTLAESKSVWKMTADAFAVSSDGGKTWKAGMDSSGNAVVNVLSAIGINCDWIHSGTLILGGYNNQNGVLKILDASGTQIGLWDKEGISLLKGKIAGPSIDLGGINNKNGVLRILDADGKQIGLWNNAGIVLSEGTIAGPSVTLGGKDNANGILKILDENGKQIGLWSKDGIALSKGTIAGPSISLGGKDNANGVLKVFDANGNQIGIWDKSGIVTSGQILSNNQDGEFSILIYNGNIRIRDAEGNTSGIISYLNNGISIQSYGGANSSLVLKRDGTALINASNGIGIYSGIKVGGGTGKTGRAEFSDGSYLSFYDGVLIGGNTTEGGSF